MNPTILLCRILLMYSHYIIPIIILLFFFKDPATNLIYTLSLHDALPIFRFESSSVPTTLPTAYDVYPLDGRHDGGYYTVKDCVTIDVLPRTPGNNVYVGFMVWSNFTATKCRGLVSLNQVKLDQTMKQIGR